MSRSGISVTNGDFQRALAAFFELASDIRPREHSVRKTKL
jgi:hypothetical protein